MLIYTTFKVTYAGRIKEARLLSSIGMDKKNKNNVNFKEAFILGTIGLLLGILLGILISNVILKILNNIIAEISEQYKLFDLFNKNTRIDINIPLLAFFITSIIIYIIVFISSKFSARRIQKNLTHPNIKVPIIVQKIFGLEGAIAYKNIRANKNEYRAVVMAISVSIILFLSMNGLFTNLFKQEIKEEKDYNAYSIMVYNSEDLPHIIDFLKERNLVNDYYVYETLISSGIKLEKENLSNEVKDMIKTGIYKLNDENKFDISTVMFKFDEKTKSKLLEKARIKNLKENEIIITNTITKETKYGNNIPLTNLKIGDTLKLNNSEQEFKIVGIIDDLSPYRKNESIEEPVINIITSDEIAEKIKRAKLERGNSNIVFANIETSNPNEIDKELKILNEKEEVCFGSNLYGKKITKEKEAEIIKIAGYAIVRINSICIIHKYI